MPRTHGGRDGQWIRCDPSGHCQWVAKTSVAAARMRIYEASRGALLTGTAVDATCGNARCVNLDHLRISRRRAPIIHRQDVAVCRRGHELTPANVVRHRDGRVAYCRACRNERRRERYRTDAAYAHREIERQRRLRRRS